VQKAFYTQDAFLCMAQPTARPPGIPVREFPGIPGNPPRQKFPAGIPGNY